MSAEKRVGYDGMGAPLYAHQVGETPEVAAGEQDGDAWADDGGYGSDADVPAEPDAMRRKAGADALTEAADDLDRVGAILPPGAGAGEGVLHKGFVLDWLRDGAARIARETR